MRIYLFGKPEIHDAQGQPVRLTTRKVEQLLAYLCLHRDQAQARERLAGLLWGESPEEKARVSLRAALHALREALEPKPDQKGKFLLLSRTSVQFNPEAPCWVDLGQFEKLSEQADVLRGSEQTHALEEAVALYRGELLQGTYDEWCLEARDRLKDLYLKALQELVVCHTEQREFAQAIHCAKELLAKNPLLEEVHRQLIYLYFATGNRNAALEQYRECQRILKEALDVEPLPETQALYREIEARIGLNEPEEKRVQAAMARDLLRRYPELGAPFVGRADELAQFVAGWEAARAGQGRTLCIRGDAGVGKTRLAQELGQYVEKTSGRMLAGRCYELEARMPFHPLAEALRAGLRETALDELTQVSPVWLEQLVKLVPELGERLGRAPTQSPLLTPEQERQRLFEGLTQVLLALARQRPLALCLDDLQWADEPTLQFLHYLARRIAKEPLLLMGVYRTGEVDENHPLAQVLQQLQRDDLVQLVELSTLSAVEVDALVAGMLKLESGKPAEALIGRIRQGSGGNPFFAVELLKSFIESGTLYLDEARNWQIAEEKLAAESVPESVRAVVQMRLRRLSHRSRELLSLAATIGRAFEMQLLYQSTGWREEEVLINLEELLKSGLLVDERPRYNFNHDLIRLAVHTGVSAERHRGLHLQVGKALEAMHAQRPESNGIVGEIAKHFYESGQWERALDYALLAGQRAWASYAKREAIAFYQMALEMAEKLENRQMLKQVYKRLGEVYCFTDEREKGLQYSLKALDSYRDPKERADIYCAIANVYHYKRDLSKGLSYCERALQELGPEQDSLAGARVYYYSSAFLNWLLRYDEAIQHSTRALRILEKEPDESLKARILSELGHAYSGKGDYASAAMYLAQSASLAEKTGDLYSIGVTRFKLGIAYYNGGDLDRAIKAWHQSLQTTEHLGNPEDMAAIYNFLTLAAMRQGAIDQALHYAHKQLENANKGENSIPKAEAYGMLGCLFEVRAEEAQAKEYFAQALKLSPEDGSMYMSIILSYLTLDKLSQALIWLQSGSLYLKERHIEFLKSCPAFTRSFDLFRHDSRFKALAAAARQA
jgi:predicted ATPase/DNA-binding SARP family transcriptional activator